MSKTAVEQDCPNCGSEFMITFDSDNHYEEPRFCPFCTHLVEEEVLDFSEDEFDDE